MFSYKIFEPIFVERINCNFSQRIHEYSVRHSIFKLYYSNIFIKNTQGITFLCNLTVRRGTKNFQAKGNFTLKQIKWLACAVKNQELIKLQLSSHEFRGAIRCFDIEECCCAECSTAERRVVVQKRAGVWKDVSPSDVEKDEFLGPQKYSPIDDEENELKIIE